MKSIVYIGAALMAGASIYGFVDYKKDSRDKEFTEMYKKAETPEPPVIVPAIVDKPATKKINAVALKTAGIIEPKKIPDLRKYRVMRQKHLSYKLFSRAPLEDRYIDKKMILEQLGKEKKELQPEKLEKANP